MKSLLATYFQLLIVIVAWSSVSSLDKRARRGSLSQLSEEHDDDDHSIRLPKSGSGGASLLGSGLFHPGLEPLLSHAGIGIGDHHVPPQGQCEPIKIGLCMEVGYNQTTMPNLVGHDAQADADALLQTFTPLIQYGCSPHLKLFLCSAHAPMCTDKVPQPIGPCRSLCESVRRKCEPVLIEFGFKWPPPLDCSKFYPQNNHEHMCIPGPMDPYHNMLGLGVGSGTNLNRDFPSSTNSKDVGPVVFRSPPPRFPDRGLSIDPPKSGHDSIIPAFNPFPKFPVTVSNSNGLVGTKVTSANKEIPSSGSSQCLGPRKFWTKGACWIKCTSSQDSDVVSQVFTESEKTFARNYALPWAILSLSAALIAFLLSLGSPRLSTAERPIIYIALCQVMYSAGVILGSTMTLSCFVDKGTGMELLAGKGSVPSPCAVVFLLTYFFGTASTLWWVVLCLSWMLSVNRKVCLSLEQKEWALFYLLTWGIASVLTSAALILKKVEADELTGLCGVGFQDMEALTYYQMIPLNTFLSLGLLFLLSGLLYRVFPNWNTFFFNLGRSRVKSTAGSSSGTGGARNNQGYSPVLVLPPPPTSCQAYDPHSTSPSVFAATGNNSSSGIQRIKALENSKAVWKRIGIFSLVHILPLACQVGTMAYELSGREDWEAGRGRPTVQVLLLRLNMNLWSGVTTVVWVLSTYSCTTLSSLLCPCQPLKSKKGEPDNKAGSVVTPPLRTTPTSPLLVPVPFNSSNTSFITSAHSLARQHQHQPYSNPNNNGGTRPNFAGILPRCHNHPLPPLPARNNPEHRTDAWRRGETIV